MDIGVAMLSVATPRILAEDPQPVQPMERAESPARLAKEDALVAKAQLEEAEDAAMYTGRSMQSSTTMAATTTPRKSSLSTAYLARRSRQLGDAAEKTLHAVIATLVMSVMLCAAAMGHIAA